MADFTLSPNPMLQQPTAVDAFARGVGIVQEMQNNRIRQAMAQQQMRQQVQEQEALKTYGQTGDMGAVMQKAPLTGMKLSEAQMGLFKKAIDYWDDVKGGLSLETYGPFREKTYKQFPQLNPNALPPPETFKTAKDFDDWKWNKEREIAKLKQQALGPKVLKGGDILAGPAGNVLAQAPLTPLQQNQANLARGRLSTLETPAEKEAREKRMVDYKGVKGTDYANFRDRILEEAPDIPEEEIRKKWSLKQESDIPKWALTEANKLLSKDPDYRSGINPDTSKEFAPGEKDLFLEKKARGFMEKRQKLGGGKGGKQATFNRSTFYNTFKAALSGPNRDAAIAHAQKNDPDFLERAKSEGLLK